MTRSRRSGWTDASRRSASTPVGLPAAGRRRTGGRARHDSQAQLAQLAQDRTDAQAVIDHLSLVEKAIVLALIDALNVVRAGLPSPLPPVTVPQALAAIRTKAGQL